MITFNFDIVTFWVEVLTNPHSFYIETTSMRNGESKLSRLYPKV